MKALTIHNPFAHLLITPQDELPAGAIHKRCENRTWPAPFRGRFAIHAGVSLDWFDYDTWPNVPESGKLRKDHFPDMAFGAIVAVAEIVESVYLSAIKSQSPRSYTGKYDWLLDHVHATGPYCFIVENVIRLADPIPCAGQQKFWTVPSGVEAAIMEQIGDLASDAVRYVCG